MSRPESEAAATFADFPKSFPLTDRINGKTVLATCIPLSREIASNRIDKLWWTNLPCSREVRRQEPDQNWRWVDLLGDLKSSKGGGYVRGWAVEVEGEYEVQGAILYRM